MHLRISQYRRLLFLKLQCFLFCNLLIEHLISTPINLFHTTTFSTIALQEAFTYLLNVKIKYLLYRLVWRNLTQFKIEIYLSLFKYL